ncbi:hypothetical protein FGIG_00045, partial [Fasciola gigantica]
TLNDRKCLRILTFQNGSDTLAYELVADSSNWESFLQTCTNRFQLGGPVRRVFGWNGEEIKNFSEIPRLDESLLGSNNHVLLSQTYRGPVWVSKGENHRPLGTYQYFTKCLRTLQSQLEPLLRYKKERRFQCSHVTTEACYIIIWTVVPCPTLDMQLYLASELEDTKWCQFKEWIRKLKRKQDTLKEEAERERTEGCHYTMRHISEVKGGNKNLAVSSLMHLKVAMNGEQENPKYFDVHFDLERVSRLTDNKEQQMRMLLDQVSQAVVISSGPNSARVGLIQRLFFENGQQVTNVRQLRDDVVLFASFGENGQHNEHLYPFSDLCLQIALFQVLQNDTGALQLEMASQKVLKSSKWKAICGLPKSTKRQLVYRDQYELTSDDQLQDRFPDAYSSESNIGENEGNSPLDHFSLLQNQVCFRTLTIKNPCFYEVGDENLVLTCLQHATEAKSGRSSPVDEEEKVTMTPNSSEPILLRNGLFVAACKPLDRAHDSCQRWAIKQERWSTFGQWRFSCVDNPEWHRRALTWPIDRDGEPNNSLIWPVEGQLIPFAPPLNPVRGQPGSQTGAPKRLRVLKNGEANQSKAIFVTGPNVTKILIIMLIHREDVMGINYSSKPFFTHPELVYHAKFVVMYLSASYINGVCYFMMHRVKYSNRNVWGRGDHSEWINGESKHDDEKCEDNKSSQAKLHCTGTSVSEFEFNVFLDRCTSALHMISAARRVFDEDGTEHWSLDNLKRDQLVYVTSGEPFANVCRAQQEARLRTFFGSLSPIVDRADWYVSLVDQMKKDWVLTLSPSLSDGAELTLQHPAPGILSAASVNGQSGTTKDKILEDRISCSTAHERACQASDFRWAEFQRQRFDDPTNDEGVQDSLAQETQKESIDTRTKKRRSRKEDLQRFSVSEDGIIYPQANPSMALTVIPGQDNKPQLQLKKRRFGDELQRLKLNNNRAHCVLRVLPFFRIDFHDLLAQREFTRKIIPQEITAANLTGICTHAIIQTAVDQESAVLTFHLILAREDNLGESGSLGLFHGGHLDLSTYEARWSVQYWKNRLTVDLTSLNAMRSRHAAIRGELNERPKTGSVKLLVYANGDARLVAPKLCIGSSIDGLRDLCTVCLELVEPIQLFYAADGTVINDLCDLFSWGERNYSQVIRQASHWQKWFCSNTSESAGEEWPEKACLDMIQQTVRRHSTDGRSSLHTNSDLARAPKVIYFTHPDVKRLVDLGVLHSEEGLTDDIESDGRMEPLNPDQMPQSVEDADLWPHVTLAPRGELFQIGHVDGPGQNRDYELVIKISGIMGLLEIHCCCSFILNQFLPRCILTVKEETPLTLVLSYEIFGHRILTDLFEPNATVLDDQTEIRIRSRLGPLRNYFTRVCPELSVSLHAVVDVSPDEEVIGSSDLKIGPAIANTVISLRSLMIVRDADGSEESSVPEQYSPLRLIAQNLHSPRLRGAGPKGEDTVDDTFDDTENLVPCDLITSVYLGEKGMEETLQRSPSPNRGQKSETKEVDWSSLPIEVWASRGEEFIPLHNWPLSSRFLFFSLDLNTSIPDDSSCSSPQPIRRKMYSPTLPKRSLYQQPLLKRVLVYRNRDQSMNSALVWGDSLQEITHEAGIKLGLNGASGKLYTLDGSPINQLDELRQDQLVCLVRTSEQFQPPKELRNVEISANWIRAKHRFGPDATNLVVQTRAHPMFGVDAFAPTQEDKLSRSDRELILTYEQVLDDELLAVSTTGKRFLQ